MNTSLTSGVNALSVNNAYLFAGTFGGGVFQRPVSEMITSVYLSSGGPPKNYGLDQNYPNPFNPATTIRFNLPVKSKVRLLIFNLLGQQITELANEEVDAGYFQKVWSAGVASGPYFYRLEAVSVSDPSKRFVDVKKMILFK